MLYMKGPKAVSELPELSQRLGNIFSFVKLLLRVSYKILSCECSDDVRI